MAGVSSKWIWMFLDSVHVVISVAAIGFSIWLHFSDSATLCQKVLLKPLLIVGVPMLFSSVLLLVGLLSRNTFIHWMRVILLSLFILGVHCFALFGVLVTNRNMSRALFGRDGNYSHYLVKKYLVNAQDWEKIKSCFVHFKFGHKKNFLYYLFSTQVLLSCCQPPTYCGLEFHNATYWTMPKAGPSVADDDCKIWSNVQTELCFNCQSCTTAFVDSIQKEWKMYSLIHFVLVLVLHFAYCVAWCVHRKNISNGFRRYKVYPE